MASFPVVDYLDAATFVESQEDPAIAAAQMDGGYVISRPRFTRRPRRSFAFAYQNMSDTDHATMQAFWNTTMGSSDGFDWTHPGTGEVINCRFDPQTKFKFTRIGFGATSRWNLDTVTLQEI